jgi:hypothetical protein
MLAESKLTQEVREAMEAIRGGADISSPYIAKTLRELEQSNPSWLVVCKPMGSYDGAEHIPYFGAILTTEGVSVLDATWSA